MSELVKKKIKMSPSEEADWEDCFSAEQARAQQFTLQIQITDDEIHQMVYGLYGLDAEKISIVEGR